MAQDKAPQAQATAPEPDFTWRWHLKVLTIIYASLAVLYTIMLWALAEPEFKWSSQAVNLVILYLIPVVLGVVRTVLLNREKKAAAPTA